MTTTTIPYNHLPSGTVLCDGQYVLKDLLAVGGMGAVYRGVKKNMGGFALTVAIKELLPHLSEKHHLLDLFFSEAKLHANLCHSNIVRVVDLFEDRGRYYIVLEWVEGMDLRNAIKKMVASHRSLPVDVAIYIFHELLQALNYAHHLQIRSKHIRGIIHRDISPSNILLSTSGEVKLTDFGISQAGARLKNFKKVPGKKGYMPPEQVEGEIGEARSDIYSLCVCMFESLTLINPIGFTSSTGRLLNIRQVRSDIPSLLEEIIEGGMSSQVGNRPDSDTLLKQFRLVMAQEAMAITPFLLSDFLYSL
ncbi:serine/threonine protein kinase [Myxococcota bacterium]|nr:serine/threonine protein kinase [Myxococcota bacterium]